jgi:hypothetical protein
LRNEETNENIDYPHGGRKPQKCKREAEALSKFFQDIVLFDIKDVLPSILLAKKEYLRVCELQK